MTEWQFIAALAAEADCDLLLDVNNIYVSSINHGFSAREFIAGISGIQGAADPPRRTRRQGELLIDTHDAAVPPAVWDLYRHTVQQLGAIPTMIERDGNIPQLAELVTELQLARDAAAVATAHAA